jgi:hypothetical protein
MTMTAGPQISTSFGRYQKEAVFFNRIMPSKPFRAIFGWLRATTQYHLAPMCTTLPTSGWLTCPIPWHLQHQLGSPFRWFAQRCSTCWQLAVNLASRPRAASSKLPQKFRYAGRRRRRYRDDVLRKFEMVCAPLHQRPPPRGYHGCATPKTASILRGCKAQPRLRQLRQVLLNFHQFP